MAAIPSFGREVFLAPVHWDENGVMHEWMEMNLPVQTQKNLYDVVLSEMDLSNHRWCYLRDYHPENYHYEKGALQLKGTALTLEEADTPTFIGVRQSEFDTSLEVKVSGDAREAGVTFYMDESQHYDIYVRKETCKKHVELRLKVGDVQSVVKSVEIADEEVILAVESKAERYQFFYIKNGEKVQLGSARTKYLSSEVAGGFTGVVMGLYAIDEEGKMAEFKELVWKQGNVTK